MLAPAAAVASCKVPSRERALARRAPRRAYARACVRPRAVGVLGTQPWQPNEVAGLLFGCFLLGSFLGAFKADALIARGQASTLSGGGAQKRWKEQKAQQGDGTVFVLEDAVGEDDADAEQ